MASRNDSEAKENLKNQTVAAFYSRYPGAFDGIRQTFSELFSIAKQYSEAKSYDLAQRALVAISHLFDKYLALRSGNLSMPISMMAMMNITDITFDAVLIEELESFVSLAHGAFSQKDRQVSQQVFDAMGAVALKSLEYRALLDDHGTNPIAAVIYGHIYAATQEAVRQQFDDGVLAGLRSLREIAKGATRKNLYITINTIAENITALTLVSSLVKKQLIVAEGVRALMEILQAVIASAHLSGSHTIDAILNSASTITKQEIQLDEPGLSASLYVQQTVGPFLGLVQPVSLAYTYEFALSGYYSSCKRGDWESADDFRRTIEEVDDWIWHGFGDVGELAARKQSFVIYLLNSTVARMINSSLSLWYELNKIEISGDTEEGWQHRHDKDDFRKDLLSNMVRTVNHVYWRLVQGFPNEISTTHIWDLPRSLSQIGIRAVLLDAGELSTAAVSLIKQLSLLSVKKSVDRNVYAPPRFAEYIARVGIIALQNEKTSVVEASLGALKECQTAYAEKINSSEELPPENRKELLGRLIFEIKTLERETREARFRFDEGDVAFYREVKPEFITQFVTLLRRHLGPELI